MLKSLTLCVNFKCHVIQLSLSWTWIGLISFYVFYLGYECQQAIKIKVMSIFILLTTTELSSVSLLPWIRELTIFWMPGVCPRCSKAVYFAEEIKTKGEVFHKLCFNCSGCKKLLEPGNFSENDGNIYCRSCYGWVSSGPRLSLQWCNLS